MSMFIFLIISSLLILSSLSVVLNRSPIWSILSLIACFLITSIVWLALDAEFLALALIFIYVGAVMVMFLFIVFMLNIGKLKKSQGWLRPVVFLWGGSIIAYTAMKFPVEEWSISKESMVSNTKALGILLYRYYDEAFILLGCLILAAMVSVIAMIDQKASAKTQCITEQINRDKKDCITWM